MGALVFDHVMKTGGNYVIQVLKRAGFSHVRTKEYNALGEVIDSTPGLFHSGHYAFMPHRYRPRAGDFYFTFVRNPAAMVYSSFSYWKKWRSGVDMNWRPEPFRLYARIWDHETIEGYVDAVLASPEPFFPETVFSTRLADPSVYAFIGTAEDMRGSLRSIGRAIGRPITESLPKVNTSGATYDYRRADLERRLEREFEAVAQWL